MRAAALVRARQIDSDADAGPLLDDPPADVDPEILKRLRQMYEAGGWVLVESALADLPGDLRWLYESGAVTIDQLAAIHRALGVDLGGRPRRGRRARSRSARSPASTPRSRPRSAPRCRRCAR